MIISAYFFVGRMKSSKAGLTNFEYCRQGVAFNDRLAKMSIRVYITGSLM